MKTEFLLKEQVNYVLAALTPENRLVAEVCLQTGLRLGDVLAITREALEAPRVMITEAKTRKRRAVSIPKELRVRILMHAFEVRDGRRVPSVYAFPGRRPGEHRTRQAVWKDVKRAAKAFRLPQNVAPHSFRKVYAVKLLEKYGDLERVRRALNHSDMATTMIYAMADLLLQQKYGI